MIHYTLVYVVSICCHLLQMQMCIHRIILVWSLCLLFIFVTKLLSQKSNFLYICKNKYLFVNRQ